MKKIICLFILVFTLCLTSCSKRTEFFTKSELDNFGLSNLVAPDNSSNYYNKSNNKMLFCYMNVQNDDDVRNYVLDILEMLDNTDIYKVYGYAKADDMYKDNKKIYLSKNIDDYLVDDYDYSKNSVSYNAYEIYYVLDGDEYQNQVFDLCITSYTEEENHLYLTGYNLLISITKRNASNYTIVNE